MIAETRRQNREAKAALIEQGLVVHQPDPALAAAIEERLRPVRRGFVGGAYSAELLGEVEAAIEAVRAKEQRP